MIRKKIWLSWVLLIAGLIITLVLSLAFKSNADEIAKKGFEFTAKEIGEKINTRLHAHAQLLRCGAAFLHGSDNVTREEWKTFIKKTRIDQDLPGILGFGFSKFIYKKDLAGFIKKIKSEGFPNFNVWPKGERDTYSSITFLEPFSERSRRALGYDMLSEPVRREAMMRARDMDIAALSGKVTLVQETGKDLQSGTLMYVPLYRKGAQINTIEQRREALIGWVYSPYRMNDLMHGILDIWKFQNRSSFNLDIYDGTQVSLQSLLFEYHSSSYEDIKSNNYLVQRTPITFNNHIWTLVIREEKGNIISEYISAWIVLFSGVLISLLIFFLSKSLINTRNTAQEIADQITMELKESEERFRSLFENSPIGIYRTTPDGKIIIANPALLKMLEYDQFSELRQLKELNLEEEELHEDSKFSRKDFKRLIEKNNFIESLEQVWKTRKGKKIFISENAQAIRNPEGEIIFYDGTVENITERKKAENEIRNLNASLEIRIKERTQQLADVNKNLYEKIEEHKQAEERIRLIVESASNAIIVVDSKGIIRLINKQTELYFGYSRTELLNNNIDMLVPHSNKEDHSSFRSDFMITPTTRAMGAGCDLYGLKKDGSKIPIEVSLSPLHFKDETMVLTSIIDISERKLREDEIKSAKREAEQANAAKSEFLSRMSHELRTPMNSILGFAQLMEMDEKLSPAHKKGVKHIMNNGRLLLDLINEVLELSRIEAGKISISLEPVELTLIISETINIVSPLAEANNIKIEAAFKNCDKPFVKADRQKLKQVMINLINNAVKYNRIGGTVKIECKEVYEMGTNQDQFLEDKLRIRLSVSDTGYGIESEEISKLFKPFQRVGAEQSEIEGTGLGLSVAKKLMEVMNGKIGVESKVGIGSTFWIELDQSEEKTEGHKQDSDIIKPKNKTADLSGTLLYIEDNDSNIQLIKQIIDTHYPAINLITEMYGKNAVKLASDYKPNLILLDLDLPDIHGSEVLKLLKINKSTQSIPVVILSANAMTKQIEKMLNAGADDYLTKPLDVIKFLKILEDVMSKNF